MVMSGLSTCNKGRICSFRTDTAPSNWCLPFTNSTDLPITSSVLNKLSSIGTLRVDWKVLWTGVVVLFFLISVTPALAQDTATLRGLVSSADDGSALVNANVLLRTLDGERVQGAATNLDGFYELRNIDPGRYRLRISYVGFQTREDTLSLAAERRQHNVELVPAQQTLDEVRVEAERGAARRAAGVQTVGSADLDRIPTPGASGDLAAYLQTLPGVVSIGDRGGQLFIRGGTPSQNLVHVDGIRIMKPFHISGLYSSFPQEIVKSADVHAGGFGAEFMGAVSSVIDVSLRKGNMKRYEGGVSVGPFMTSARIEGPIREGTDSFLAVARRSVIEETAGPLYDREVPLGFYDLTSRYSLELESAACSVTGMLSDDRGQVNPNRNLELSWSNVIFGGRCLFFGAGVDHAITLNAGYSSFENAAGTIDNPQRTASVEKIHLSVESEQEFLGNTLNYGGRWIATTYGFDLDEKFTGLERQVQSGGAVQGYASMEISLSDRLTVTPSFGTHLTVRRISSPTYEPRLRVSFLPDGTDQQEVNFAVGKYNQVAEGLSDERDAGTVFTVWRPSEANEPLLQALHGILGYRQEFGTGIELSVEGYAKDLSNIPVPKWSPVAKFDIQTALANGLAYGVDARLEIDRNPIYVFLGYGWANVQYDAARQNLGAWRGGDVVEYSPPHDRRHQVNFVTTYNLGDFTTSVNWKLTSGRPYTKVFGFDLSLELPDQYPSTDPGTAQTYYDRPYNGRLPAYHRLDVSVERSFDLGSDLSLDAKVGAINVYDRQNVFYYDINEIERVNQTPLLPYASLSFLFE